MDLKAERVLQKVARLLAGQARGDDGPRSDVHDPQLSQFRQAVRSRSDLSGAGSLTRALAAGQLGRGADVAQLADGDVPL
jgi:hypothetical protein